MSSSDRVNKMADLLLSHSLEKMTGLIAKVTKILDDLRQNPPQHIEILKRFAFLVRRHVSTYQGTPILWWDSVKYQSPLQKEFIKGKTAEIKSMNLHL